jgi:hypothetical protein
MPIEQRIRDEQCAHEGNGNQGYRVGPSMSTVYLSYRPPHKLQQIIRQNLARLSDGRQRCKRRRRR